MKSAMEEAIALVRSFFFCLVILFFINSFVCIASKITIIADRVKKRVLLNKERLVFRVDYNFVYYFLFLTTKQKSQGHKVEM